jgi:hypothetical protein
MLASNNFPVSTETVPIICSSSAIYSLSLSNFIFVVAWDFALVSSKTRTYFFIYAAIAVEVSLDSS